MTRGVLVLLAIVLVILFGWLGGAEDQPPSLATPSPSGPSAVAPRLLGADVHPREVPEPAHLEAPAPLPPPSRPHTGAVTLTVRCKWDGRPAVGALVSLTSKRLGEAKSYTVGNTGRVRLADLRLDRPYMLMVNTHFMGPVARTLRIDGWTPRDQTLELERGYVVTGSVVDESGAKVRDAVLWYRVIGAEGPIRWHNDPQLRSSGRFEIRGLRPSRVQITVTLGRAWAPEPPRGFGRGGLKDGPATQTLDAGTRDVLLRVKRGRVLKAFIHNWDAEAKPSVRRATLVSDRTGARRSAYVDDMGNATFYRLPPGDTYRFWVLGLPWNLYVEASGLRAREKHHNLAPKKGGAITGRFRVPEGVSTKAVRVRARDGAGRVVHGHVDAKKRTFKVEGLPIGTWTVIVRAGVQRAASHEASIEAVTGDALELVLAPR